MHKCCENCRYFYGYLEDPDSYFHIHDYCSIWRGENITPMHSLINEFLDSETFEISRDELPEDLDLCIYDDHETGESYCYRFEELPSGERENRLPSEKLDIKLKANYDHNKRLALFIINKMLNENKIYNPCMQRLEEMSDEDRQELEILRDKIERQTW